jgi:WD40 repeat protein
VIETETGVEKIRMSHADFIQKVEVSPDGSWIASTGYDKVVRIWDASAGSLMLEFPLSANGSALSFNQDGTRIVAADESGVISIWDISSLYTRLNYIEFTEFAHEARFTPSGEFLIVNTDDNNVWRIPASEVATLHDGTQGEVIIRARSLTYDLAISPDSKWVAVVENDNVNPQFNRAHLVSMDGEIEFPLQHGGEVTTVGFTADSQFALTAGVNGLLEAWSVESAERIFDIDNGEPILSLAVSPTNNLAVTGLRDKAKVWDLTTKQLVTEIPLKGFINSIVFSNDGQWLATGNTGGTVTLLLVDNITFTREGTDMQFSGDLNTLAFSPNGQWLAGGDARGFAFLWDVATQQELSRIRHGDAVTSVAFSNDGTQLITVSRKVVRVWDMSAIQLYTEDELNSFACQHFISNLSKNTWVALFGLEEPYKLICPDLQEGTP